MNVVLVGHACSPYLGSEPGLTWNWAKHLAKHHSITVVTHPQYKSDVEAELAQRPLAGVEFMWVSPYRYLDPWNPARGERFIRLHYSMWQRSALAAVKRLQAQHRADLVHHVSWGSLNQPPVLWRAGIPFVWGPIGGGQVWPSRFLVGDLRNCLSEHCRTAIARFARWNPSIAKAARNARLVLATNRETAEVLRAVGARDVRMLLDNGTVEVANGEVMRQGCEPAATLVVWGGRCEPRKGLHLAIAAMAQVRNPAVRLAVAGDGPSLAECERMAQEMGLCSRITFLGKLDRTAMLDLIGRAQMLLFTSLRDSFGSIVMEAMARGTPMVTLDHQGVGTFLPDNVAVKVRVGDPVQVVSDLAAAIDRISTSTADRERMAVNCVQFAQSNTWERRAQQMSQWYEEIRHANCDL